MRTGPLLILLTLSLLAGPTASALEITFQGKHHVRDLTAPPGEALVLRGTGTLVITGSLATQPSPGMAGAPGPDIHILVDGALLLGPDAVLQAASGRAGESHWALGSAVGGHGGRGGSITLQAHTIALEDPTFMTGDGGPGGHAHALGTPDATAHGGNGGPAGALHLLGPVTGTFTHHPGDGGPGGTASAKGGDADTCEPTRGDDRANMGYPWPLGPGTGGNTSAQGEAGGCGSSSNDGGPGGNATAYGGHGGIAPNGTGGSGGHAYAWGGIGGRGGDACFPTREEADA
ncbi:MAG: hypothetical protein R3185_08710, partial [Candidatus Thermoplasmatota archaeon]|nr:hypothetical protein [Candidatus Thermoplasmatota archaeon]